MLGPLEKARGFFGYSTGNLTVKVLSVAGWLEATSLAH
jgi:hypothetical protein